MIDEEKKGKTRIRFGDRDKDDDDKNSGIQCPNCECRHLPVYRTTKVGERIRRERRCRHCGRVIYTYEATSE